MFPHVFPIGENEYTRIMGNQKRKKKKKMHEWFNHYAL